MNAINKILLCCKFGLIWEIIFIDCLSILLHNYKRTREQFPHRYHEYQRLRKDDENIIFKNISIIIPTIGCIIKDFIQKWLYLLMFILFVRY